MLVSSTFTFNKIGHKRHNQPGRAGKRYFRLFRRVTFRIYFNVSVYVGNPTYKVHGLHLCGCSFRWDPTSAGCCQDAFQKWPSDRVHTCARYCGRANTAQDKHLCEIRTAESTPLAVGLALTQIAHREGHWIRRGHSRH